MPDAEILRCAQDDRLYLQMSNALLRQATRICHPLRDMALVQLCSKPECTLASALPSPGGYPLWRKAGAGAHPPWQGQQSTNRVPEHECAGSSDWVCRY